MTRPRRSRDQIEAHALLERRSFIRLAGMGGLAAVAGGGLLSACSSEGTGGGDRTAGSGTSPRGTVPDGTGLAAYDPSQPYWMQGNFAPVGEETEAVDLTVRGALPPELEGVFARNGSNPASSPSPHWFLGDGMVHGVRLDRGKAIWYRNKWVQTPYVASRTGLADADQAPGGATNQSNVSVISHAGRLLSLGEVGWPYELSTDDLATVGPYDFGGALDTAMTAHPKIDPATGELHFFGYGFVPPYLTYHVADASGALVRSEAVPVERSTMMHDFAITDRDAIFWEQPVLFDLDAAVRMVQGDEDVMPFVWDPQYGARIGVMPLGGSASEIRWVEIDPCYVFHGTNCYRNGDDVVIDVCRLPSAFSEGTDLPEGEVRRWTVGTGGGELSFSEETLSETPMDLPSIDRRWTGREYRHGWYVHVERDTPFPFEFMGLGWLDHVTGETATWDSGPDYRPGEGFFVAGDSGEGEGWLLTYVYDATTGLSDLVVLDALDVAAGPVATVELPVRVPYGFHGVWVPGGS